tara:strand:- start:326 stop:793 length:468 start_codon:yes stop_codon:yes gene_type:complete
MPNGKKTRTVIVDQNVKLTPEQRNAARDFNSYKYAFTSGEGILSNPFMNATTPEGKLQSMQWKKGFGSARRSLENQGYTFGEPFGESIENTSQAPVQAPVNVDNSVYGKASRKIMSTMNNANAVVSGGIYKASKTISGGIDKTRKLVNKIRKTEE